MSAYAYVRYLEDGQFLTVPISWVENFDEKVGIKKNKKYSVKWPSEDGDSYDAEVIYTGASEEAITHLVDSRRVRCQNKDHLMTDSDKGKDSDEPTRPAKVRKLTTMEMQRNHMQSIMDAKINAIQSGGAGPSKESAADSQQESNPATNKPTEEVLKLRKENLQLKKNNVEYKMQIEQLTRLNIELQGTCINNVQELLQKFNYVNDAPPTNLFPEIGKRHRDNTHIGNGIWIPTAQHDSLLLSFNKVKDGSKLVTSLSCCVFGTAVLAASSVTGKKSNAKKDAVAKPPLDPKKLLAIKEFYKWWLQKKKVNEVVLDVHLTKIGSIIASKIYDLNRPIRTPKKSQAVIGEGTPLIDNEYDPEMQAIGLEGNDADSFQAEEDDD